MGGHGQTDSQVYLFTTSLYDSKFMLLGVYLPITVVEMLSKRFYLFQAGIPSDLLVPDSI